ncbi:MAG TPA: hypothetical protein VFJ74_10400, partial [Gemmatimonadaceae bacterium]|nr:hypothetical protein [Gemmatimonadaceae bacterium]
MSRRALRAVALALLMPTVACRGGDAGRHDAAASANVAPCGTTPADGTAPAGVTALAVNRGTHGMAARVRWKLSPDRCAVLVVEDPAGVENDPIPNGFLFAAEREGRAFVV